jgi:uncharacterized protein YfbU (UPF0304 family)
MGDRGYRGCEYVEVCESEEQKGIMQVVEGVNSQIKLFNRVSRWREGITLLAYLYGYAIGYREIKARFSELRIEIQRTLVLIYNNFFHAKSQSSEGNKGNSD